MKEGKSSFKNQDSSSILVLFVGLGLILLAKLQVWNFTR